MAEDVENKKEDPEGSGKCLQEREEYLNGWKRAKADLINYQKDEAKRFEEILKFANSGLLAELVKVLDSFDLAAKHSPAEAATLAPVRSQLEDILKKQGLEKIPVEAGQPFSPAKQETVGEMESVHPPGSIAEVVGEGYILNGKVIRPVKVKLSK